MENALQFIVREDTKNAEIVVYAPLEQVVFGTIKNYSTLSNDWHFSPSKKSTSYCFSAIDLIDIATKLNHLNS